MKKLLSTVLVPAMVAATMTACGGSGSKTEAPAETKAAETGAAEGAEAAAPAEGGVLKIGGIGPVTGPAAIYGEAVKNGIQIAVDEINAAGGINGMTVEYQFEDDVHDQETAVNAYNTLKDWGMQMLIGTVTSNPCVAVAAESAVDNMFQITPSATSAESVKEANVFRVCFSDPNQGSIAAKYIGENCIASKIAVIYESSDPYSSGIWNNFDAEAANQGLEIVAKGAFTADNNKDFSVYLQQAKDAGAELIFLPIYYTEASLILAQASNMGLETIFYGCDGLDGLLDVENFDTSLAEGVLLQTPVTTEAEDELTQNLVAKYEEVTGSKPNQFAADGYDALYIIKAVAEAQGITADMSISDMCEAMKTGMTQASFTGLTGADISWGEDGEPNKQPLVVKIVDGVYQVVK